MGDKTTELQSKRLDRIADRLQSIPEDRKDQLMATLDKEFYSVREVATLLDRHAESVRRWIRAGDLDASKAGNSYRISRNALNEFWMGRGGEDLLERE